MDEKFLAFLGNFFANAARGQKQLQDISGWMSQGFSGFDELTVMFRKFYGLDEIKEGTPDFKKLWKKSAEDFEQSFNDYLELIGVVSQKEHLELVEKYESLKKKAIDQEETINHLRMLLKEKGHEQGEFVKDFSDLMEKQTEQFREAMKTIGGFLQKEDPEP